MSSVEPNSRNQKVKYLTTVQFSKYTCLLFTAAACFYRFKLKFSLTIHIRTSWVINTWAVHPLLFYPICLGLRSNGHLAPSLFSQIDLPLS